MQLARNKETGTIDEVPAGYSVSTGWESLGSGWYRHKPEDGKPKYNKDDTIEVCLRNDSNHTDTMCGLLWDECRGVTIRYYRPEVVTKEDKHLCSVPVSQTHTDPEATENDEEVFSAEDVLAIVRFMKLYPGCFFEEK